jgi:hypothetical protein
VPSPLYRSDADRFVPGVLTVGPWSPDAQHGGPVSALLAGAVESVPAPVPMQVVRLTVELLRPVPLLPLTVTTSVTRPGKKVQLVDASLTADGTEVARARGLRIRVADVDVPEQEASPPSPGLPTPDSGRDHGPRRTAFADALDLRFVKGSWDELGPVTLWSRLLVPVVDVETPSQLQRVVAAADFGNGVSRIVDFDSHVFINADLTVALSRLPAGDWIGFDVVTRLSGHGYGQAESLIFDAEGPVGRAIQSLFVDRR